MGSSAFFLKAGAILLFLAMVPIRFAVQWRRNPEERRLVVSLFADRQSWRWGASAAVVLAAFNLATGSWFTGLLSAVVVGLCVQLILAWRHQTTHA
jgi:hypothetical protein